MSHAPDNVGGVSRAPLITGLAVFVGAVLIIVASVLAQDSISGGGPSTFTVVLRIVVLATSAATYAGILLYYSRKNAAFGEHLQAAADTPLPDAKRKKKKKKR